MRNCFFRSFCFPKFRWLKLTKFLPPNSNCVARDQRSGIAVALYHIEVETDLPNISLVARRVPFGTDKASFSLIEDAYVADAVYT